MAQQVAEKALKAFLYAQGLDSVVGHSVSTLCEACAEYESGFGAVRKRIKNLDQYYIETRYPSGLPDGVPAEFFDEDDAETALSMARTAVDEVSKRPE